MPKIDWKQIANPPSSQGLTAWESGELLIQGQTVNHSLGRLPYVVCVWIRCKSAELGYSVGDEVSIGAADYNAGTTQRGLSVRRTATIVELVLGSDSQPLMVINKGNGNVNSINPSNWRFIVALI